MSTQNGKIRPSGAWYLLPAVVFLVGAVIGVVLIVSGVTAYNDTINGFGRVPVNGEGVVNFEKSGKFTAFLEQPGIDSSSFRPVVTLTMTSVDDGTSVVFDEYSGSVTYANGSHEGRALKTFRIEEPGRYRLEAFGQSVVGEIAVGRSPFTKLKQGILTGVLSGGGGFVVAVIILIVLAVRRGKSKRAVRAAQFAGAGPGGPPYGQPGYPGQPQWQGQQPPYGQPPAGPGPGWPQPQPPPAGTPNWPPQQQQQQQQQQPPTAPNWPPQQEPQPQPYQPPPNPGPSWPPPPDPGGEGQSGPGWGSPGR